MGLVLGITGPNAAGKGEVSAHLKTRGFDVHSLSDIVREEAAARNLPPSVSTSSGSARSFGNRAGSGSWPSG